jgi:tRNA U34 5-methylaminomethyl-2-thiouridine-forming methyltransferase MnmC
MTQWIPEKTGDGSHTFFSPEYGETFHSRQGAKSESFQKFAIATQLAQRAQADQLSLLDVCYGLGYNSAASLETIWQVNPHCHVTLYALEIDDTVPIAATVPELISDWQPQTQVILKDLATQFKSKSPTLDATLLIGDARQTIQTLIAQGFKADAICLDPFSPRRCPQLWTIEFCHFLAQCLAADGRMATYSRSASVRKAFQEVGLKIGTIPLMGDHFLPHEWAQGTTAAWQDDDLQAFSQMELEHLNTRAATPYRDPSLTDTALVIRQRQQEEVHRSTAESTSSWRKRWGLQ